MRQLDALRADVASMTSPRMCIPGATYLVTRTVVHRLFLLKPSPVVRQVFGYCLARAAAMFGVLVHAVCVESTHFHLVVTDSHGRLSDFMHWLDRHVARCLIEHYGTTHPERHLDAFWSKAPYGATVLVNREAILGAIVYTLTNPQKDGLVADYRDWPGFHTRPSQWLRKAMTFKRPQLFFNVARSEHREAELRIVAPEAFSDVSVADLARDVASLIREKQEAVRAEMRTTNRSFLGEKAVLASDPFDAPRSQRKKGGIEPRVAAGGDHQALALAKKALQVFRQQYREAWKALKDHRKAMFPGGTLLWSRLLSVDCAPLDTPWCLRCIA